MRGKKRKKKEIRPQFAFLVTPLSFISGQSPHMRQTDEQTDGWITYKAHRMLILYCCIPSMVSWGVTSKACQERCSPVSRSGRDMNASFHTWKHLEQEHHDNLGQVKIKPVYLGQVVTYMPRPFLTWKKNDHRPLEKREREESFPGPTTFVGSCHRSKIIFNMFHSRIDYLNY